MLVSIYTSLPSLHVHVVDPPYNPLELLFNIHKWLKWEKYYTTYVMFM